MTRLGKEDGLIKPPMTKHVLKRSSAKTTNKSNHDNSIMARPGETSRVPRGPAKLTNKLSESKSTATSIKPQKTMAAPKPKKHAVTNKKVNEVQSYFRFRDLPVEVSNVAKFLETKAIANHFKSCAWKFTATVSIILGSSG